MKMLALIVTLPLSLALVPALAQAATVTCQDIQTAAASGPLEQLPFKTQKDEATMKGSLLRKAIVISESLTQDETDATSFAELEEQFDPLYGNFIIAGKEFQFVDLSLGDNPYVYLFNADKETYSGIYSADGSILVDGKYCETDSDIF